MVIRANKVFAAAGVDAGSFYSLTAITNKDGVGSSACMIFRSVTLLEVAATAIDSIQISLNNDAYVARLSRKRTRDENRPRKLLHRAFAFIMEQKLLPDSHNLTKALDEGCLKLYPGGIRFVWTSGKEGAASLFFAEAANEILNAEHRSSCAAYAEA